MPGRAVYKHQSIRQSAPFRPDQHNGPDEDHSRRQRQCAPPTLTEEQHHEEYQRRTSEKKEKTTNTVPERPTFSAVRHRQARQESQLFGRSEEHKSELQSLNRISYAVSC